MKAKDWADKFKAVPESEAPAHERYADLLKEFGTETAELMIARTKGSTLESRFPAAEGVVREQKNKFRSLCGHGIPGLTEAMFDQLLMTAVPDYFVWQKQAQKKKEEKKTNNKEDDVKNYRNRGRRYPNRREDNREQGRQNEVRSGSNPNPGS